jgi:PKD repeat protein
MTTGSTTRRGARVALAALLASALLTAAAAPAPAGSWLPAVDLSRPLKDADKPAVAMDAAGRTVAIWHREGTTPFENTVQASVRSLGAQFSDPLDLSLPSFDPQVAMTPSGEAVAAWWQSRAGGYVLQLSRRPPDGAFSPPLDVAEAPNGASVPETDLALGSGGVAALAWLGENAQEKKVVMASVAPAGSSPSSPVELSDPEHDAFSPSAAVAPDGRVAVAWSGFYSEESPSAVQLSTGSGGSFSEPLKVSNAEIVDGPQLALDGAGNPTLLWRGLVEEEVEPGITQPVFDAIEARSAGSGGFGPVAVLYEDEEEPAFFPRLGIAPGGVAVAVWARRELGGTFALDAATRASSEAAFSPPAPIAHDDSETGSLDLAVAADGAAALAWHDAALRSQVSLRPAGGQFGTPVTLDGGREALFPKVALDDGGDAAAVWRGTNGTNEIVRAAGFDASPPELRNLAVPAEGTVGLPVDISVEPFDVWPLAEVGFDFGDGSSARGASVSHVYAVPGSYRVTASAQDSAGASTSAAATIRILASNDFRLGRLKRNKRTGRATLVVHVPGPGRLVLRGRGLKKAARRAGAVGVVKLPVRAVGRAAKRLRRRGRTKVRLHVVFEPDGGRAAARARTATLKKSRGHRRHRRHR